MKSNITVAICIIAYNRVNSLKRLLHTLDKAEYDREVELIISIDKSDTLNVLEYSRQFNWTHGKLTIIEHKEKMGLKKHVLSCGKLLDNYDGLVVLEDDITVAESFYYYAVQTVEKYKDDMKVAGISLYSPEINYQNLLPFNPLRTDSDVYYMQNAQSWGQIWMKKQWNDFILWYKQEKHRSFDIKKYPKCICYWPDSSWLKYHIKYCIDRDKYFIYPYVSLSTNNNDVGTHNKINTTLFQTNMLYGVKKVYNLNPTIFYDSFYENLNLRKSIGIDDLCVNLYGEKNDISRNRYILTFKRLPYKIIGGYSVRFKPWEMNVLHCISGSHILLYDTCFMDKSFKYKIKYDLLKYLYNFMGYRHLLKRYVKNIICN